MIKPYCFIQHCICRIMKIKNVIKYNGNESYCFCLNEIYKTIIFLVYVFTFRFFMRKYSINC